MLRISMPAAAAAALVSRRSYLQPENPHSNTGQPACHCGLAPCHCSRVAGAPAAAVTPHPAALQDQKQPAHLHIAM